MTEFGDRLLVLLVAATGLAVLLVGWAGGLVQAQLGGMTETLVYAGLAVCLLLVLAGVWIEFGRTDQPNQ